MLNIIDSFRLVFSYFAEKRGRILLTILGIIIGIFVFSFFIFVSQSISVAISDQFSVLGVNIIAIQNKEDYTGLLPEGGASLTEKDIDYVKKIVKEYKYVAPGIFANNELEYKNIKTIVRNIAYPDDIFNELYIDFDYKVLEGRMIRSEDKGVVMLGYNLAKESFSPYQINVGENIKISGQKFRVIGIFEKRGDLIVDTVAYMDFDDLKKLEGNQEGYSIIQVSFFKDANASFYANRIEDLFNRNNHMGKEVVVISPSSISETYNSIISLLTIIISFVSSIALLVGGINIMNTMYSNVLERSNEISVMKALGATNKDILLLFLIEGSILGLIGSLIGFFLSYLLAKFLSYFIITFIGYNVQINFNFTFFLYIIFLTIIFTIIFCVYPALKAANIIPADNLRDE